MQGAATMDLPTFAETEGAHVPLPETVEHLAEVIGRRLAVTLVNRERGAYVPKRLRPNHPLCEIVGYDAAWRLAVTHSHCLIEPEPLTELKAAHRAFLAKS
jgi:hypothetical protein